MFDAVQWITWQSIQYPGEDKPRKIPCGGNDAHNPIYWMTYEDAKKASNEVGFVLTENDPYFCIDLDDALQADGRWSQLSLQILGYFPDAYVEVSYSGKGLHIFGTGIIPEGFRKKNTKLKIECYDRLRFIAVTGMHATGNPKNKFQERLNWFVETYLGRSVEEVSANWTTTPRGDWHGPEDDDELIERMLKARPSANSLWGGTASLRDLWEGNKQALIDAYPDGEDSYDESTADMALATHLAFWTGANCERMDRLMRRSGLMREKYNTHKSYLTGFTIPKAVGMCQKVYNDGKNGVNSITQSIRPEIMLRTGLQYLSPDAQIQLFQGCTYIINTHRVLRPNGTMIGPDQFKAVYGGYLFALDTMNDKTTKNAWEAFTMSQAVSFPKVEGVLFRPELEPGSIVQEEGLTYVNSYQPVSLNLQPGNDVGPFLDLLSKLFPDDQDQLIIVSYMAAIIQHPGVKFQWCPLIQGAEGNGKSFLTRALIYAIGQRHSHLVNPKDIANKFNAWIEGKLFIGVEEVYVSDKRDMIDALKIMITNDRLEIQPKGGNQYMGDNRANFLMNSNHQDAIRKTKDDRRYAPFFTPQQSIEDIYRDGMGGDYFPDLYNWARREGYAMIAHYLNNYVIPDELNPATRCHRAPHTTSTEHAIQASLGVVEQEVVEAIEASQAGFRGGFISSAALDSLLKNSGKSRYSPLNKRAEMLWRIGYEKVGRSTICITQEGNGRPVIFKKKGMMVGENFLAEYMTAQGYSTI